MISKLILNSAFDFDGDTVSIVPIHSRGVDVTYMRKHASFSSVFAPFLDTYEPQKNQTVIHVIAVGDEEMYGPNRNGDGFSREDNVTAHRSFVDNGHVFKHHQNDDPFKAVGDVIQSAHSAQMSRIELLLGLDNNKCDKEIHALDKNGDLPVSMGSMQDYDVCSICKNKAPTARDHCHHIKNMLGMVLNDGRRVYMQNPRPKYFDISLVFKPADRIAYTLRKVASANDSVIGGHELAEIWGLAPISTAKHATVRALATMYKQVPATLRKAVDPTVLDDDAKGELKKQAQLHGIEHLLAFLSANGWLLGPRDFGEIIGHDRPEGCEQAVNDLGSIEDVISDHSEMSVFDGPAALPYVTLSGSTRSALDESCGMQAPHADRRMLRVAIIQPAKTASAILDPHEAKGFADLYSYYKLAFAHKHSDHKAVLQNVATTF